MTKSLSKLFSALCVILLLAGGTAFAGDLAISYKEKEDQPCVPGVSGYSQAVIEVYLATGGNTWLESFEGVISPDAEGLAIFDANTTVTWNEDIFVNNATYDYDVSAGDFDFFIDASAAMGVAAINATADPVLLLTVAFDVDSTAAGKTLELPFEVAAAVGRNTETSAMVSLEGGWLSDGSIDSISFNVYQSFNFFVVKGATFAIPEDTELTIDAADADKFEATAWDGSALAPTTDVEFTGKPTLDPAEAGTISVKKGALVFKPTDNWNGEVTVSATAKSTTIADTDTAVEFPITVTADDDPLVVTVDESTLAGAENAPLEGTITLNVLDVDGDKSLNSSATLTLSLDGYEDITVEGTVAAGDVEGTYVFTPGTTKLAYTAVDHVKNGTGADYAWTLAVTANVAASNPTEPITGTVTIEDKDQPVAISAFTVNGNSADFAVKATDTLEGVVEPIDADVEDTPVGKVLWSVDDGEATATVPAKLVKGQTIKAQAIAESFNDDKLEGNAITITVVNSAPVVPTTWGSIFVLRNEDASTPKPESTTFTATDADGAGDLRVCAERTRSAEPSADTSCTVEGQYGVAEVALEGETITVTYTVNTDTVSDNKDVGEDIKFYVTDADEKDFIEVTVNCTFQANPPPVLALAEGLETEIPEVDDAEAPRAFILTVHGEDEAKGGIQAGVSKWELIDLPEGWQATADPAPAAPVTTGVWSDDATWTITTAGFGTLDGANRPAAQEFTVKVRATDVKSGAEVEIPFTVKVSDTDRAPEAPQSLGFDPAEVKHGDNLAATATGAETDADGDAVTFTYAWSYSVDGGATFTSIGDDGNTLADAAAFKRGYVIRCEAVASATPAYEGGEAKLSEGISKETTVGNTAPAAEEATIWTLAEGDPETEWVTEFTDVDVDDGVDELTYALGELSNPDAGELALSEDGMTIAFTPAADYNTVETGDEVTFTVTATDLGGATATTTVTLVITEKNTAPSFSIADQYVLPSQLGEPVTVAAIEVTMGENEGSQGLSLVEFEVLDGADLFDAEPTAVDGYEGASEFSYTFTIKADAALGSSAKVKVTVTDNGTTAGGEDPLSAEKEFTIFLGASPWYPILSFECADPDNHTEGHTVVIDDGTEITVKGATYEVKPGDYVAIGHPGYAPNTTLNWTVYVWTQKDGKGEICQEAKPENVSDYDVPADATTDGERELAADDNGFVELPKFSVPMAKSYTVVVKKDGEVVQTIEDDFMPNDEGMVLPDVEGLTLQLTAAGEYTVEVSGVNPAGKSEPVVLFTVTSEGGEAELADVWEGDFVPGNGDALTSANVRFSWPALKGATSYTLSIYDGDGRPYDTIGGISGTSQVVELAMDGDVTNYSWFVTATNGTDTKESAEFAFVLSESSGDTLVITKVVTDGDGLKIYYAGAAPESKLSFAFQYFDVAGLAWTNGNASAEAAEDDGVLAIPLGTTTATGDFVVLKQGDGEWKIYEVQAQ